MKKNETPIKTETHKDQPVSTDQPIVKELEPMKETRLTFNLPLLLVALSIIIAGGITGYVLAQGGIGGKIGAKIISSKTSEGLEKVVGIKDEKTFKDSAQGVLKEGGIDGEGSHHLERAGGPSQDVYLTSSVVDLDKYVGKKVMVWGETFSAQKAGWFMDVGRLELLE